jgi:hypothetical protein
MVFDTMRNGGAMKAEWKVKGIAPGRTILAA